jgi:DNA-binding response OmpR family regulator
MPVMDGITALVKIREASNLPVILLTAKSQDADMISGLNVGADDYITKPFNPTEVAARVKSQLRRYMRLGGTADNTAGKSVLTNGGIELDEKTKTVTVDGEPVNLTPTEMQLLKLFMFNPGTVFSPKDIYRKVWNDDPLGAENTVTVHIRHLREKIEINPANPDYIKSVWGHGYKMDKK